MLVKVDKFIFLAYFVVLDMEEDFEIPIILGCPFLATGKVIIDVQQGKLTLRVNDENVVFNIYESLSHHDEDSTCHAIDIIDHTISEHVEVMLANDHLEQNMIDFDFENVGTIFDEILCMLSD